MGELSNKLPARLSGRTREEIDRDFREHCRKAASEILVIGYDLIEMKQLLEHGEWSKWLAEVGWKERTAQQYIQVARAWDENPKLMQMGYSRTVALLAAPAELREQAEEGALDGKSAAEIRRLSQELKNSEQTQRELAREIERRDATVSGLLDQLKDADRKLDEAKKAAPKVIEKVVEKIPEDYDLIRKQLRMAEDAAEEAEQRAAEAVRQAQDAMAGQADEYDAPSVGGLVGAVNRFLGEAGHLPYAEDWLRRLPPEDRQNVRLFTDSIWHWAEQMLRTIERAERLLVIPGEGAVSNE